MLILLEFLLIALVFFFLGRWTVNQKEDIEAVKYKIKQLREPVEVGTVRRPDADHLRRIREKGTPAVETEIAMEETFNKILSPKEGV